VGELGPIDYVVVEFPSDRANFSGEAAKELTSLVDRGLIRVMDLLFIRKHADGASEGLEVRDFDDELVGPLREMAHDIGGLLAEEDVAHFAAALEPDTIAAVLVWENAWAGPFAAAVRRAGGQLAASGRISVQAILAALEADEEAAKTEGA
jgi:hypothetical protein